MALFSQYYRFYPHLCSLRAHCTNRNISPTNNSHNLYVGILASVVNLLSNNTQLSVEKYKLLYQQRFEKGVDFRISGIF